VSGLPHADSAAQKSAGHLSAQAIWRISFGYLHFTHRISSILSLSRTSFEHGNACRRAWWLSAAFVTIIAAGACLFKMQGDAQKFA
jgi:hypothetical protein